jgi:hypothetical protein
MSIDEQVPSEDDGIPPARLKLGIRQIPLILALVLLLIIAGAVYFDSVTKVGLGFNGATKIF